MREVWGMAEENGAVKGRGWWGGGMGGGGELWREMDLDHFQPRPG